MKLLATAVFVGLMSVGLTACAKEEPKKEEPKQEVVKPKENDNCVRRDRDGKCPPLPDSPRPTPRIPIPAN